MFVSVGGAKRRRRFISSQSVPSFSTPDPRVDQLENGEENGKQIIPTSTHGQKIATFAKQMIEEVDGWWPLLIIFVYKSAK